MTVHDYSGWEFMEQAGSVEIDRMEYEKKAKNVDFTTKKVLKSGARR